MKQDPSDPLYVSIFRIFNTYIRKNRSALILELLGHNIKHTPQPTRMYSNNIIPRPIAKEHVFVLKRPYTNTLFSTNHGCHPSVIAFKDKRDARKMHKWVTDINNGKATQKIVIESMPVEYLIKSCTAGCLDLTMIHEKSHVVHLKLSQINTIDDARFHFENTFLYYSSK